MRKHMFGVAVLVAILALCSVAEAVSVINGGSILTDFEVVGRWEGRPNGGYRNVNCLTYVPEDGGVLYAVARSSNSWSLRKWQLPAAAAGVVNVTQVGNRALTNNSMCYDPNYNGGTLIQMGLYMRTGRGVVGGADNSIITADAGDVVLSDNTNINTWKYHNSDGCFLPAEYSLTGRDAYVHLRNGGGANRDLQLLEPKLNAAGVDTMNVPQLPGRGTGQGDRSVMLDLAGELGMVTALGVEFAGYEGAVEPGVMYIVTNHASDPYHLIALTPGPDGLFGESTPGVCDDVAVGYTFGEPGQGNNYQIEKQNITWENAPGDTALMDIDGSYNTGYRGMAYDPTTNYLYLHGSGDYGWGVILKDISGRVDPFLVPEPAGLGLVGLALLALKRRRR